MVEAGIVGVRTGLVVRLRAAGCVFAEEEADALLEAAGSRAELEALVARRVAGEPLEVIVGRADFAGIRVGVVAGVFVPRRRSELVVLEAVAALDSLTGAAGAAAGTGAAAGAGPAGAAGAAAAVTGAAAGAGVGAGGAAGATAAGGAGAGPAAGATGTGAGDVPRERTPAGPAASDDPVVVDLCCGTGAIGLAVANRRPGIRLFASDVDPVALGCASVNLAGVGTAVRGDLGDGLPAGIRGRVDVLAINAPYVPTDAVALMPREAREHEPRATLDGGPDGLDFHRRIAAIAPGLLSAARSGRPGGVLVLETGEEQAPMTAALLERRGLVCRIVRDEELDGTVVVASHG